MRNASEVLADIARHRVESALDAPQEAALATVERFIHHAARTNYTACLAVRASDASPPPLARTARAASI